MATELQATVSQEYKIYDPIHQKQQGNDLITGYYGHATTFTSPDITEAAFTLINDTYGTKITAANSNDTNLINERNDYYNNDWLPAVEKIRIDVNKVAAGKKSIVDLSGFHSTKVDPRHHEVGGVMALTATSGVPNSQEINYESKTVTDARSFFVTATPEQGVTVTKVGESIIFEVAPSDKPVQIIALPTTKKKGTFRGSSRGDIMNVNMLSTNGAGNIPLSNTANVVVP